MAKAVICFINLIKMEQHFLIKGMVCDRCIAFIKRGTHELGLRVNDIRLGKIIFDSSLSAEEQVTLSEFLIRNGFEPMSDRHTRLINKVKQLVQDYLLESPSLRKLKFSALIAERLNMNYDSVSELFSSGEGITIEKYLIHKRIEKVIEMLVYSDRTLTEISHHLGYSSINHLSKQFKEITGFTPSHYRKLKNHKVVVSKLSM
jgi:AraC family transcriptional regulator